MFDHGHSLVVNLAESGWQFSRGQVVWRQNPEQADLAGDLLWARHADGRVFMQMEKPPLIVLTVLLTSNQWSLTYPATRKDYSGGGSLPEDRAWLWVSAALEGQALPPAFSFKRTPADGWSLVNTNTGEMVEGLLSP